MASTDIFRVDLVDIDLDNSGSIHRSFLNHAIGLADKSANRFGVRLFRSGQPVNLANAQCEGFFMAPNGNNLLIQGSGKTGKDGNAIWVQLPQVCYDYEGQFTLAIKVIDTEVTGTMRIVDGVIDNTGTENAVTPVADVPTYQEVIATYNQAIDVINGSVRHDTMQAISDAGQATARSNIEAQIDIGLYIDSNGYICQLVTTA